MKNRFLSLLTIFSLIVSVLVSFPQQNLAKDKADISALAYLLPESNIILAMDMDRMLNYVGPNLLSNDESKIENLKKLAKSAENTIGIDPYEIQQVVIGVNFENEKPITFFDNVQTTVLLKTKGSNQKLIERWIANLDKIEAFKQESEPATRYMVQLKRLRSYQITKREKKSLEKLLKKFKRIEEKTAKTRELLSALPRAAKVRADYKRSSTMNKSLTTMISDFQKILNKDTDTKTLNNSVVKLQNRLYLLEIDDANRKAKLDHIFTDAKSVYPVFKSKIEETRFTKALVGFSSWEFYEKFSTADFGEYEADITKPPAEIIESKLDTLIKSLSNLPKTRSKRNKELALVTKNYRALDKAMKIYLGALDDIAPLSDIRQTAPEKMKKKEPMSEVFKKHAKFSTVNGKQMIAIDESKLDIFGDSTIAIPEIEADEPKIEKKGPKREKKDGDKKDGDKKEKTSPKIVVVKEPRTAEEEARDEEKEEAKDAVDKAIEAVKLGSTKATELGGLVAVEPPEPRNYAVGFIDSETIAFGYEKEIKEILSRDSSYKNTNAAEMIDSFKNPLMSFAISSDLIGKFMGAFSSPDIFNEEDDGSEKTDSEEKTEETKDAKKSDKPGVSKEAEKSKKEEKEPSQSERFLKDLNIFGAVEFDDAGRQTQDIILSLGFTKNNVEDVFSEEPKKDGDSIELGDFRIMTNVFYDLLNSLKVFKASLGFKFEKKKVAAIIENAPDMIREAHIEPKYVKKENTTGKKRKISSVGEIRSLLDDPAFYRDLIKILAN